MAAALPSPSIDFNGEVYDQAKFDELVETAAKALQEKQGCPEGCGGSCDEGCSDCPGAKLADWQAQHKPTPDEVLDIVADREKGENLGAMIRNLRDARGLSNDDLANAAGISVSTIGQILGGTIKCPRLSQIQALARRLNVSLSRLVSAAERDGCESMDGKALDDAVPEDTTTEPQAKSDGSDEESGEATNDTEPEGDALYKRQVEELLVGYPGLPEGIDPGLAVWEKYKHLVDSTKE